MIKVSVVVPVYLAEKYIARCLESIRCQTLSEFEVLLIDDGSPDLSGKICDGYAIKDSRFRVIHKKNGGVSRARQMGLDNATGEYIIHVDPDDWIEPNMLETLYFKAKSNDFDMVICDYYQENKKGQCYIKQQPTGMDASQVFEDLLDGRIHGSCCNKLVRRICFPKYGVVFPPNIVMWEDLFVNLNLLVNSISVAYMPEAFYHYDQSINTNSAVFSFSRKRLMSQQFVVNWLISQKGNVKELNNLKKSVKYSAFCLEDVSRTEFEKIYSEINNLFRPQIRKIGGLEFFIYLALHFSLPISRYLYKWKCSMQRKIMG